MGNLDYLAVFDQHRKRALRADIKEALPAAFEQDRVLRVLPTAEFRNVVAIKWDITTDLLDVLITTMERAQEVDGLLDRELEKRVHQPQGRSWPNTACQPTGLSFHCMRIFQR